MMIFKTIKIMDKKVTKLNGTESEEYKFNYFYFVLS